MIKKAYYYFFYKIYKSIEYTSDELGGKFWSDWKASLVLDVLFYFIITSLFIYYKIFFNRYIHLSESNFDIFLIIIPIILFNYFIFHHKYQWKNIVKEFDRLPREKNLLGGWIVFGIILFIIANLIFSFYLMSQIDWVQYR
ncbi:hypothetical protein [Chryseobacterium daecheongense]|uniref:Uncharacterized protein n=1 Tax=Chryseobacterium daecheongense TaxID=192389 RepID=A0A3N0VYT0_9FLAO|nr:hypothetical protein [Chryseobacterium daecheongense]ROH97952.1 hypothetical protein EGI05_11425 [Chryseobacterium daecheongense]TDX92867.1 hypothetical protein BCF50_1808 [Chryseobacterium daecheongense]